jgi:hypothetical protein
MTLLPKIGWYEQYRALGAFDSFDRQLRERDVVVTPRDSLDRVIREYSSGGSDPDGVRLTLSPGFYFIKGDSPMVIDRDRISLSAAVPGQSVIVRETSDPQNPMISVTGEECALVGLVFDDANAATGARGACISITGDNAVVSNCQFLNVYQSVLVDGAEWSVVRGNRIDSVQSTSGIQLTGSGQYAIVHGNMVVGSGLTEAIRADDAFANSSFVGNVTDASVCVSYKTGLGNAAAGNVGSVTVRP